MSKRGLRGCGGFLVLVLSASLLVVSAQQPMVEQAPTAEQLEFFEGRVRPVLAEKCFQCHSTRTSTPFGGLRLDSRQGLLTGGDSGPAVVPGHSADSTIVQRIQGRPVLMPPTGRLDDDEITALLQWVDMVNFLISKCSSNKELQRR